MRKKETRKHMTSKRLEIDNDHEPREWPDPKGPTARAPKLAWHRTGGPREGDGGCRSSRVRRIAGRSQRARTGNSEQRHSSDGLTSARNFSNSDRVGKPRLNPIGTTQTG